YEEIVKYKKRGFIKNKYLAMIPIQNILEASLEPIYIQTPRINVEDFEKDFRDAINTILTEREAWILKAYFGLDGEKSHTYEEVGLKIKITRERVRQIKERALSKLKQSHQTIMILKEYLGEKFI
ncbi:unnamed protein product, partial [marine sediment metagenome]